MIRVGVIGACGRMGRTVCAAVATDPDLALVAAVDVVGIGEPIGPACGHPELELVVSKDLDALCEAGAEVAVDFTAPGVAAGNIRWAIGNGVHIVVGTSGISQEDLVDIRARLEKGGGSNVFVAPNFAIGAVLAERFAAQASKWFPAAEIIELHHDAKADAPSATALHAARLIASERAESYRGPEAESLQGVRGGDVEGLRIHSVRLPGLVAHQEIIFGGPGQILSIRHDSMDRVSFMPGVLMAIRAVASRPGLSVGLDALLG